MQSRLPPEEIQAFAERGYHIHGRVFSDAEVETIRDRCEAVCAGTYDTGTPPDDRGAYDPNDPLAVKKIDNAWKADATVAKTVTDPRLGEICGQLIHAPQIRLWHDQYLHKPPGGGKVVTWHQDWAYWQMVAECRTVTCWIALDDVEADMGPMIFLEGTHQLGLYPLPEAISGDDEMKPELPDGFPVKEVSVCIPKGCVSFHHGLTLHGSGRNHSDRPRRSLVAHVISGECTYRPGQSHMNERCMQQYPEHPRPGERFRGPQFPVIWPAESGV